jgi:hypothetical protein
VSVAVGPVSQRAGAPLLAGRQEVFTPHPEHVLGAGEDDVWCAIE